MTKTLDKQTLTRMAWLAALRREGHRKCEGTYADLDGNFCALGLLLQVAGHDHEDFEQQRDIAALAGLNDDQGLDVTILNDGRTEYRDGNERRRMHSFAEIADIVEGWFRE